MYLVDTRPVRPLVFNSSRSLFQEGQAGVWAPREAKAPVHQHRATPLERRAKS